MRVRDVGDVIIYVKIHRQYRHTTESMPEQEQSLAKIEHSICVAQSAIRNLTFTMIRDLTRNKMQCWAWNTSYLVSNKMWLDSSFIPEDAIPVLSRHDEHPCKRRLEAYALFRSNVFYCKLRPGKLEYGERSNCFKA